MAKSTRYNFVSLCFVQVLWCPLRLHPNNIYGNDVTEILLKVALNTITLTIIRNLRLYGSLGWISIEINTLHFPYQPGYHPETPVSAEDAVEG